jgi:hypothetical protein
MKFVLTLASALATLMPRQLTMYDTIQILNPKKAFAPLGRGNAGPARPRC